MDSDHRPSDYKSDALPLSYNSIRIGFGFDGPKTAIPFLPIFRGLLERDAKATRTPGAADRSRTDACGVSSPPCVPRHTATAYIRERSDRAKFFKKHPSGERKKDRQGAVGG